ncbi:hypothetical protein LINPERHAP2_LOCUS12919 [Linum perenne]
MPESSVIHLHKLRSDHRPIVLCPSFQVVSSNRKPFRFYLLGDHIPLLMVLLKIIGWQVQISPLPCLL